MSVIIKRDGKTVANVADMIAAYGWMHRHHSYSMGHALKYEGYSLHDETGADLGNPDDAGTT